MRVLVACECSGVVRRSFREKGHDSWSCDLQPADDGSEFHIQGDALAAMGMGWDLMIAHPPCTYLAVSGARWFRDGDRPQRQIEALGFVRALMEFPGPWCIENPVSVISSRIRKPDQIVQPWMFGHGETKATCLWLNQLPPLQPTNIVEGREGRIHKMPPSANRQKLRSVTYSGLAAAMAEQWGVV